MRAGRPAIDRVIAVSDAVADPLRRAGLEVTVVPHGTRWPVQPARPRPGRPIVGCVGLLTPIKGQLELLEAVARIGHPGIDVELVGRALPQGRSVRRAAQGQGQPARPGRAGAHRRTVRRPRRAHPSLDRRHRAEHRGRGRAAHRPRSHERGDPVVASDAGGPRQYVGDAGLLVPPADVGALAGAIARLVDDEAMRRQCGEAGRRRVAARYTLDHQRAAMLAALHAMIVPAPAVAP